MPSLHFTLTHGSPFFQRLIKERDTLYNRFFWAYFPTCKQRHRCYLKYRRAQDKVDELNAFIVRSLAKGDKS